MLQQSLVKYRIHYLDDRRLFELWEPGANNSIRLGLFKTRREAEAEKRRYQAQDKKAKTVKCWVCEEATIPDTKTETIIKHDWGFVQDRDDFAPSGTGPYFACPTCRTDN